MHEANRPELLSLLDEHPHWLVLDVGGGEQPLMRADWEVDLLSWDDSGNKQGVIGDIKTCRLSEKQWVQMDICGVPLPFPAKHFDFVVCSNVLEDVRDPVHVVKEINRVGKRGYFEYPRPWQEMIEGVDERNPGRRGYWHHRWMIDYDGRSLNVLPKHPIIDGLELPPREGQPIGFEPVYWHNYITARELFVGEPEEYTKKLREFLKIEPS